MNNNKNIKKSIFNKNNLKKISNVNFVLNIAFCSSTILFFGFNIWALAIAYIGSDILLSILNTGVIKYNIKKTLKINKIEDLRDLIQSNAEYYCSKGRNSEEFKFYTDLIDEFESEVNKQVEKEKKLLEKSKEEVNIVTNREKNEIDRINNTIKSFLEFYNNLNNKDKSNYTEIKELFEEIKDLLLEKPKACLAVDNFFSIYTNDLIALVKNLDSISTIKQKTYKENVSKLINEFITYLIKTKDKVQNYNSETLEMDIDFLLKELKSANNEDTNNKNQLKTNFNIDDEEINNEINEMKKIEQKNKTLNKK